MKKFLTGLLICTLFVALGATAAMADPYHPQYDGFDSVANAVASADYLDIETLQPSAIDDGSGSAAIMLLMLGYNYVWDNSEWGYTAELNRFECISPNLPGYFAEFEDANGDLLASDNTQPATLTITFAGELDADGAFTDTELADVTTADFVLLTSGDLVNIATGFGIDLSSNDFFYVCADGAVVASDDVADGLTLQVPVAENGVPLFPAKQVVTLVFEENEDNGELRTWFNAVKLDLVYDDQHTCATAEQARDEAEVISSDDIYIAYNHDYVLKAIEASRMDESAFPFELRMKEDGKVVLLFTGTLNGSNIDDISVIEAFYEAEQYASFPCLWEQWYADHMPIVFNEEDQKFYLALAIESPVADNFACELFVKEESEEYLPEFWANAISEYNYYSVDYSDALWMYVPVAQKVGTAAYQLCQPEDLPWNVAVAWNFSEEEASLREDLTWIAQKFDLSYRVEVKPEDVEAFMFTNVVSGDQLDAELLASALTEENALFDLWTSEDVIAMGAFNVASDSPVNINLASDDIEGASEVLFEFSNTASGDVTSMDFAYTAIFSEDALRFDIFVPAVAKDLLEADTDGEPTLTVTFTVEDTTDLQIIMGGVEVTEFATIDGTTVTLVFTRDGDLTFSDLSGTIFEMKAVPDETVDPDEHTGSSSGGCSVGSFAPFALLLLAPLSLLRK